MTDTITVEVKPGHLRTLSSAKHPIDAVVELVWNSLDADASRVDVAFETGVGKTLKSVVVSDNGDGISREDAFPAFKGLGGSWKRSAQCTRREARLLHGAAGQGRFRAFALGGHITWNSRLRRDGVIQQITIHGFGERLGEFLLSDTEPFDTRCTGTDLSVSALYHPQIQSLLNESSFQRLMRFLAPYLTKYPQVSVIYGGWTKRREMPVIQTSDVRHLQTRLKNGKIDLEKPFAKDTNPKNPFPEGLGGFAAKAFLERGLKDGDKNDDKVQVSLVHRKVKDLIPIQKQIYFDKSFGGTAEHGLEASVKFISQQSMFIISKDNYLIDGHHRFLTAILVDPEMRINCLEINLPIKKLLPMSVAFGDAIGNKRNQ
ncbi:ATP-binding protein [bacterium]|nr:ATP-binding protein [bacterium]